MFRGCYGLWDGFRGPGMEHGFFMMPIIGIIIIVLLAIYILRKTHKRGKNNNDIALQILNKKLAKGEITEEEYINKKQLLNK